MPQSDKDAPLARCYAAALNDLCGLSPLYRRWWLRAADHQRIIETAL